MNQNKSPLGNYPFGNSSLGGTLSGNSIDMLEKYDDMSGQTSNRKIKKFLRIAIPIFVIEIITLVVLLTYLIVLPKNYCKITTNYDDAVIYINGEESNKFRFEEPKESTLYYYYGVDISVKLPDGEYVIEFTLICDKYAISATTTATKQNGVYSLQTSGGKTQLLSAITLKSSKKLKNFTVDMNVKIQKI